MGVMLLRGSGFKVQGSRFGSKVRGFGSSSPLVEGSGIQVSAERRPPNPDLFPTTRATVESTHRVTGTEPAALSDLDLVRQAQAGDSDAFGELVERNRRAVFRAALAAVGNAAEADDVAQETFVTAYRKLAGFRGEAAFRTWLLSIAWRKAIDRRKSLTRWLRLAGKSDFDDEHGDAFDRIASPARPH